MADKIDKSLTQGPRGSAIIPGEKQIQEAVQEVAVEEQQAPGPIEQTELEDGSVQIDFDPQAAQPEGCLLYTSPSPRDGLLSRMPSSA